MSNAPFQNRYYQTTNRQELVRLTHDFARSIDPALLPDLTIAINGNMNGGKSLIWDEFRLRIMEPAKKPNESKYKMGDIVYKTWFAPNQETQQPMRLHTENVNISGRFKNKSQPANTALDTLRQKGQTILLSNLDENIAKYADVLITLTVLGGSYHNNWNRFVNIDTYNQDLLKSARYARELSACR